MNNSSLKASIIAETEQVRPLNDDEIELVSGAGFDWNVIGEDGPTTNGYDWN